MHHVFIFGAYLGRYPYIRLLYAADLNHQTVTRKEVMYNRSNFRELWNDPEIRKRLDYLDDTGCQSCKGCYEYETAVWREYKGIRLRVCDLCDSRVQAAANTLPDSPPSTWQCRSQRLEVLVQALQNIQ